MAGSQSQREETQTKIVTASDIQYQDDPLQYGLPTNNMPNGMQYPNNKSQNYNYPNNYAPNGMQSTNNQSQPQYSPADEVADAQAKTGLRYTFGTAGQNVTIIGDNVSVGRIIDHNNDGR